MEVLVLIDFEGTMGDELTVRTGDVVKNVSKASEDGWLQGELRGIRGIFPANFVKEVPVYLIGNSKREPRSFRKTKKMKQIRKCEVAYAYTPHNEDEMELVLGETIEIISEIEDGWWMGLKNGKPGAFPSNFVKEIFVSFKDEGKTRPKLSDAMFSKEKSQRASVRNKAKNPVECCQVMFDYTAKAEDELDLKKGDVVMILRKEVDDEGWWEGDLNGRRGFFPDNFVMVIPPMDILRSGTTLQPPTRTNTKKVTIEASAMEKGVPSKTKDDKPEPKDLRSNPPTKVKLPSFNKPSPPPVKEKPNKFLQNRTNGDALPVSPKPPEVKDGGDQFDGIDVQTEKLSHPTANRAKPPQRRPPSALVIAANTQNATDQTEPNTSPRKLHTDQLFGFQKGTENLLPSPSKSELPPKTPPPARPTPPKVFVERKTVNHKEEEPTVESLQAEIKELRMALELLQTRHERDIQEVKEELRQERNKQLALQEAVDSLKAKH